MFANVQKDGSTVANEIARLYGQNAQAFLFNIQIEVWIDCDL